MRVGFFGGVDYPDHVRAWNVSKEPWKQRFLDCAARAAFGAYIVLHLANAAPIKLYGSPA